MPETVMRIIQRAGATLLNCLAIAFILSLTMVQSQAASRLKDIIEIEGIRENQLIGYGLVVGLNGTGDGFNNAPFTRQSLISMLERMGVNTRDTNLNVSNVAAVMVTTDLPAFATQGSRIDVTVSALGNSKSLQGGTLLVTPLMGADGEVYAVAQGSITINGFSARGDSATIISGVPTTGRISSGALVEREVEFSLANLRSIRLNLRNPDLTTARRIALSINDLIGLPIAVPKNPAVVLLVLPQGFDGNIVDLLTDIEQLVVTTDSIAKIVIDENSGIIVMGQNVRVSTVAVAQSNLTVTIAESPLVSQPDPFAPGGVTTIIPRTDLTVETNDSRLALVEEGVSLRELVNGLNELGISPRDLISILQAIKAAGALQAEIEVM